MKSSQLSFRGKNPRSITDENLDLLKKSLQKDSDFLKKRKMLVNHVGDQYIVYAGNQRLKGLIALGYEDIPDDWIDIDEDLAEDIMEERAIKDNVEYGERDIQLIKDNFTLEQIKAMDLPAMEIDMEIFNDDNPEEDDIDAGGGQGSATAKIVQVGDIFQLGNHRIMCGDSTVKEMVDKLMDGKKADMVFTDPPYSVNYEKKQNEVLGNKKYNHIENDDMTVGDIAKDIRKPVFKNLYDNAKDDCSFYLTMPQGGDQMMMMMMMMMGENWQVKHELIRVKPTPVFSMGRLDYDYRHEPIAYGWKKNHNFYGKGDFTKSVWEIGRDSDGSHPTMKPVALVTNAILNSSKIHDMVIDYFLGSGSTLISCEANNRVCLGMEFDPMYIEVIIKRFHKYSNGEKEIKCLNRDIDISIILSDES